MKKKVLSVLLVAAMTASMLAGCGAAKEEAAGTEEVKVEEEVQTASVSMKKMSPREFTNALKRLQVLEDRFQWEASEVDNIIYMTGPERFVSTVLSMAKVMDNQDLSRRQVYRWKDKGGVVNFSSEDPVGHMGSEWDVKTDEKFPGFDVVDVVKNKKQAQ